MTGKKIYHKTKFNKTKKKSVYMHCYVGGKTYFKVLATFGTLIDILTLC